MTTNKVSSESPFYFQLIHVNNIWIIKTVFMQNGHRLQWYGIFPPFLIQYLPQLGLLYLTLFKPSIFVSSFGTVLMFSFVVWFNMYGDRSHFLFTKFSFTETS